MKNNKLLAFYIRSVHNDDILKLIPDKIRFAVEGPLMSYCQTYNCNLIEILVSDEFDEIVEALSDLIPEFVNDDDLPKLRETNSDGNLKHLL